jgi:hypothetical protein
LSARIVERRERLGLRLAVVRRQWRRLAVAARAIGEFERDEHVVRRRLRAAGNSEGLVQRNIERRYVGGTDGGRRHASSRTHLSRIAQSRETPPVVGHLLT